MEDDWYEFFRGGTEEYTPLSAEGFSFDLFFAAVPVNDPNTLADPSILQKMEIASFEAQNRRLALSLFGEGSLLEEDAGMLDYVLYSGTYGTESTLIRNHVRRKGRFAYLFSKVFLPYRNMLWSYPILKRFPFLLPVFWIVRIISALISKPAKVMRQLKGAFLPLE